MKVDGNAVVTTPVYGCFGRENVGVYVDRTGRRISSIGFAKSMEGGARG